NGIQLSRVALSSGSPPAVALEHRVRRLLAVDDSLTTRTLMRSILEAAGYDVVVAADGLEALSLLQSDSFDLVVADVEMPRMNGFELTEAIRRDARLGQIPVVLVTSLAGNDHRERGVAAGADAYIVKSVFEQGLLLDTVGRLL
ncbi:MAG: response regulator, partial [Chloroflexota bacterium]|nr:response regulator [Chloroflexota bacterium]